MSFLAPQLLWFLPLAGLPLLFTWLRKRNLRQQNYPSLNWLDEQLKSRLQRKNLRHWLAALWRVLILIVLIYIFAQPVVGVRPDARPETWLVVDNSPTMLRSRAGRTGLKIGIEWVEANFEKLGEKVRVARLNPEPEWLGSYSRAGKLSEEQIKVAEKRAALPQLRRWLDKQSPSKNTRVILVSDGRRSLISDSRTVETESTLEIMSPFEELETNLVLEAGLAEAELFLGEEGQINWRTWPRQKARAELTIDSKPLFSGGRETKKASWTPESPGLKKGVLELPGSNPDWAGRWYFSFPVHEKVNVYFAGSSPAVNLTRYLLEDRFEATETAAEAQLVIIGSRNYASRDFRQLRTARARNIPTLVLLDRQFDRAEFTSLASRLDFPWVVEGKVSFDNPRPVTVRQADHFSRPGLAERASRLAAGEIFRIEARGDDRRLATAGEDRLLARQDNWYILTVPPESFLDRAPASVDWPPVYAGLVTGAAGRAGLPAWTTGSRQLLDDHYKYPLQITGPGGSQVSLSSPGPYVPSEPGFYELEDAAGRRALVAANRRRSPEDFKRLHPADLPDGVREFQGFSLRSSTRLAPWLWLVLLAMLGVDLFDDYFF